MMRMKSLIRLTSQLLKSKRKRRVAVKIAKVMKKLLKQLQKNLQPRLLPRLKLRRKKVHLMTVTVKKKKSLLLQPNLL